MKDGIIKYLGDVLKKKMEREIYNQIENINLRNFANILLYEYDSSTPNERVRSKIQAWDEDTEKDRETRKIGKWK